MKIKYLRIFILAGLIYSCSNQKHASPAYDTGKRSVKVESTSTTVSPNVNKKYYSSTGSSQYYRSNNIVPMSGGSDFKTKYGIKSIGDSVVFDDGVSSGILTGGELSDFDKWDLWKHITKDEFGVYSKLWELEPQDRYMVEVINQNRMPVVDVPVQLYDGGGRVIWNARTDNTGKAEMWATDVACSEIIVDVNGESYKSEDLKKFAEGINRFNVEAKCEVSNQVDIAFIVDATGSMEDEIQYMQFEMEDIISKAESKYSSFTFKTGSVFYRCTGNSYSIKVSDFTEDKKKTADFIKDQSAREGGAELVDSAIIAMVDDLNWSEEARARIAFLVLDEPPATDSLTKLNLANYIAKSAEKGIRIVPIVASANYGTEKSLEYLMRSVALFTNGSYVFLTDDSGVGNAHAEPTVDEYDVEILNQLMLRLIGEFTYVLSCDTDDEAVTVFDTIIIKDIINQVVVDSVLLSFQDSIRTLHPDTMFAENPVTYIDDHGLFDDIPVVNEIKIWPNPTLGDLTVEVKGEATEVYLADISGKIIARYPLDGNMRAKFDISKHPAGIYMVQCISKKKWLAGKVILMK
ncbi:MAG: T9SS type A sorting domain-containing protein [Flavobacteriales bacterium]|nr:T9SS type A sorting domain-containing protein [Flavobacteriales bacterium]